MANQEHDKFVVTKDLRLQPGDVIQFKVMMFCLCRTSVAQTLMACLSWLFQTRSGVPRKDSNSC